MLSQESPAHPNFSIAISLQKGGPPFFDDRVSLLAGRANFSPYYYLTHPIGSTRSRAETISACGSAVVRSWLVQRGQLFSQLNACQSWLGRMTLLLEQRFSIYGPNCFRKCFNKLWPGLWLIALVPSKENDTDFNTLPIIPLNLGCCSLDDCEVA